MELRHLRYFVTVAEELNISRVAARLRISQPAISRQIKDLEEELGLALFTRESNGLKLTEAGQTFLPHACDILRRSKDSIEAIAALSKSPAETLAIGYIPTAMPSFLAQALRTYTEKHPKVIINLSEMAPTQQIETLRQGKIDLAFIGNPCADIKNEFEVKVIKRLPLAVAVPDHHLLALRKSVQLSEFQDEDFIGLDETRFPGRNEFIRRTCEAAGFIPRIKQTTDSLASILALVASGRGVALVPNDVGFLPHAKAAIIPLSQCSAKIEWAVASRKERTMAARQFLGICESIIPATIPKRK